MKIPFSGKFKDKSRKMTRTGYIEFSSSDVRDHVFNKIAASGLKCKCGGSDLDVKKATPLAAKKRNTALIQACNAIKTKPGIDASSVSIMWTGHRGVTVNGVYAFSQPIGNEIGSFTEDFNDLTIG